MHQYAVGIGAQDAILMIIRQHDIVMPACSAPIGWNANLGSMPRTIESETGIEILYESLLIESSRAPNEVREGYPSNAFLINDPGSTCAELIPRYGASE